MMCEVQFPPYSTLPCLVPTYTTHSLIYSLTHKESFSFCDARHLRMEEVRRVDGNVEELRTKNGELHTQGAAQEAASAALLQVPYVLHSELSLDA